MKNITLPISKLIAVAFLIMCLSACIKNDNFIEGDTKIRVFHTSALDTTQNFFLNGKSFGSAAAYGTSSAYIVVPGRTSYQVSSRNITESVDLTSLPADSFNIGKNYSIFFTREGVNAKPRLLRFEDDVLINRDSVKLTFFNLGYTLKSTVVVVDSANSFPKFTIGYGQRINKKIKVSDSTRISFTLTTPTTTNPQPVVPILTSNTIQNGRVLMVLIDGSKTGELQQRVVSSN
ncbi:DUF4397 domain-containing protein [Pedobacter sandarakinus]|uniref:DUF4397 domain-containing protein n=1 Tax=Pedobacter sandarakinus TaxID=353156 RepID=UPI00224602CC|nr:DUF4397 domain-containing protein [Pedobacter sandarakinus]MCX2575497.1 hypothetical protein [Pedobacter sandarakinus]